MPYQVLLDVDHLCANKKAMLNMHPLMDSTLNDDMQISLVETQAFESLVAICSKMGCMYVYSSLSAWKERFTHVGAMLERAMSQPFWCMRARATQIYGRIHPLHLYVLKCSFCCLILIFSHR